MPSEIDLDDILEWARRLMRRMRQRWTAWERQSLLRPQTRGDN